MKEPDSAFQAKSGGAVLIASGSVIPVDDGPLDLTIPVFDGDGNVTKESLTLRIVFSKDPTDKTQRYSIRPLESDPRVVVFEAVNLSAPFGLGPREPLRLWRSPYSIILADFRFYTVVVDGVIMRPSIHFSFYQKEVTIGETKSADEPKNVAAAEVTK